MSKISLQDVKAAASGQWLTRIYPAFGIQLPARKKHGPCPICAGKDRFKVDDKEGRGTWFCNQCGAGDGFALVEKSRGMSLPDTIDAVAGVLGLRDSTISDTDRERWKAEAAAKAKKEAAEQKRLQTLNLKKLVALWDAATPDVQSAYLERKQVAAHGLRQMVPGGPVLVPMADNTGALLNCQKITAQGDKEFLPLPTGGLYHLIQRDPSVIWITEGYATGASIADVRPVDSVAIAFNAANPLPVGRALRERFPAATLIFAGDNDRDMVCRDGKPKYNTGGMAALVAAQQTGGAWCVPAFGLEDDGLTDFNDLSCTHGRDVLREQLDSVFLAITNQNPRTPVNSEAPPKTGEISRHEIPESATESGPDLESVPDFELEYCTEYPEQDGHRIPEPANTAPDDTVMIKFDRWPIEKCLERFALIEGTTKILDTINNLLMTKSAFIEMVGKERHAEWYGHDKRKTTTKLAADKSRATGKDAAGNDVDMLERYILIYGTKEVWDTKEQIRLAVDAFKLAYPVGYEYWAKSPDRLIKTEKQLVFDPTQTCPPDCINMYQGLPITPLDGDFKTVSAACLGIRSLLHFLCGKDDAIYSWVVRWLALPLQKRGTKMNTSLLFHGNVQGAGKSLFFEGMMRKIYGRYSATLGQHQLESPYNDWMSQNLYSVFEEIFSSDTRYKNMGVVKHLISGSTIRIDKKFLSGWEESNFTNLVFLSNETQPLPIEPQDRRFLVCWPDKKTPPDIREQVIKEIDGDGIRAFFAYLMLVPMGDFHRHIEPPMTSAKQRLISHGLPSWDVFLREWQQGLTRWNYQTCKSEQLYDAYRLWAIKHGEKAVSNTRFMTYVSLQEKKGVKWHRDKNNNRKQATFILVDPVPDGLSEEMFLTQKVQHWSDYAQDQEHDDAINNL